jgi:dTDP-glucose pyrophosphorylase
MIIDYRNRNIIPGMSIIDAFKKMDILDKKLLIIVENNILVGLLSAGDIQRAIIQNLPLNLTVKEIMRSSVRVGYIGDSIENIKKMMLEFRMEFCPVVNEQNEIQQIYYWEDIFSETKPKPMEQFNLPVVIMAGGFGTRLKPLTNVIPKPLIPIGEKTIIENIFDRFAVHGSNRFHLSVNYKADLIKYYLENLNLEHEISYFVENQPLGTAGSLSLLKGKIDSTFFVSNCDIIIEQDYSEILKYHRESKNELTVVAAIKNYSIPYGTIESGINGRLLSLKEKPDLTFKINSGMYILEPHLLEEIPENEFFHITHLIEKIKLRNGNVGVFPVSEGSWKDIGEWDEYLKLIV